MSVKSGFFKLSLSMLVCVGMFNTAAVSAADLEKVTYNMAWLPQGSSIGPIVAQVKGIYEKKGLDVNIVRGYGGNRTAAELDRGEYEFGYVDPVSLVLNRLNGGNLVMIGAMNTEWPAGLCYVKSRHEINGLDDLKGLVMGGGSASAVQAVVPAWLKMNGKPAAFIKLVSMSPSVVDASLISGAIDLAECWRASNREIIQRRAEKADIKIHAIEYSDYGLNAYGSGFAASKDLVKERPELTKKFLAGAYAGFKFAIAHPEEARDMMLEMFPAVDPVVALHQIQAMNDLVVDDDVADKRPMGYMRLDRMRSTVAFISKTFDLHGKLEAKDIYTNQMLE